MDALSSFDNALLCFFNEVLLKKIAKHSAAVHLPRRRIRRQMLRFNDLKDGKMLWTTFKWLVNTSFRNVNKDVALDIQDNRVGNNTPKTNRTKQTETISTYENDENQNISIPTLRHPKHCSKFNQGHLYIPLVMDEHKKRASMAYIMNFLHWSRTLIRETVIIEYERFWNSWSVLLFTVTTMSST